MISKKFGLLFEKKQEDAELLLKDHHIYLSEKTDLSFVRDENKEHNILIEGENLHSLKMLQYTHTNKVNVIYIDPPYNTGNKDFVYNDHFVDSEDGFRHSKWLSMMDVRLRMAHNLLTEDGVIFISIDDNEFAELKMLCDSIFGRENFIANLIWKKKHNGAYDSKYVDVIHEYIFVYAKNILVKSQFKKIDSNVEDDKSYNQEDEFVSTRGRYKQILLHSSSHGYIKSLDYKIEMPDGSHQFPGWNSDFGNEKFRWMWSEETFLCAKKRGFIDLIKKKDRWNVYYKQYQFVDKDENVLVRGLPIQSIINDVSNNSSAAEQKKIFGQKVFDYAKPVDLVKKLLGVSAQRDSVILDFFAGSGTTGQAVAELNKEDGGTRQFILCTNNSVSETLPQGICTQVTYPRLEKTIGDENLKYYKVETMEMASSDDGRDVRINQLRNNNLLIPILQLKHNCFNLKDCSQEHLTFSNSKNEALAIYFSSLNSEDLFKEEGFDFEQKISECGYSSYNCLLNIPRRNPGYAANYIEFMKKK